MVNGKHTKGIARIAIVLVAASLVSGCATASKATNWLKGVGADSGDDPVILGAPSADDYLKELSDLAAGDPHTQAEIYADAEAGAKLTPGPSTNLRLALVLAVPGHPKSDAARAQGLLHGVLDQTELLTEAEVSLATIHLSSVERLVTTSSEARLYRESTSRAARDEAQASGQRLATLESDNQRLRDELAEAEQKLEAITSIERSIREQE